MLAYSSLRLAGGFDFKVLEDNSGNDGFSTLSVKTPDGWKVVIVDARGVCSNNPEFNLVARRDVVERFYNVYRGAGGAFVLGKRAFASNRERLAKRDSSRAIFGMKIVTDVTNKRLLSSEQV